MHQLVSLRTIDAAHDFVPAQSGVIDSSTLQPNMVVNGNLLVTEKKKSHGLKWSRPVNCLHKLNKHAHTLTALAELMTSEEDSIQKMIGKAILDMFIKQV